jgi:hypothetical protein
VTLRTLLRNVSLDETSERHRAQLKEYAEDSFKNHVITEEQPGVFRCAQPNTNQYLFRVAFLPAGLIVVYGDIGDMMIQRGGEDWLSGAIRHDYVSDYVLEKMLPTRGRTERQTEFMPGDAAAELLRMHDGVPRKVGGIIKPEDIEGLTPADDDYWEERPNPKLALKIAEGWLDHDESGRDAEGWSRSYYDRTGDCESPQCRDYSSNTLWCYHALSWFVRARKQVEVVS